MTANGTLAPVQLPRAYSYVRFSSSEQRRGDSLRRQVEETRKYCAENGLSLDETLTDAGVSAFRGDHTKKGQLGIFLRAIQKGLVPRGSVLIVESLDRLSREKPLTALSQFVEIIQAGVELVTLLDRQRYSEASVNKSPHELMLSIGVMARAHEESATKARRLAESWEKKRQEITAGRPVRQVLPAWLKYDETGEVVPVMDRVKLIRRMFRLALKGWGKIRICNLLDAEGQEPWGVGEKKSAGGWQVSYIVRLLSARTLIGEFQPHKMTAGRRSKRVPVGQPVHNYYPAVIDQKLFEAVQTLRKPDPRGRSDTVKNLFTGLCYDGRTGAILHIEHHGRAGGKNNHKKSYLTTARTLRKLHGTISWRYDLFEGAFLNYLRDLNLEVVVSSASHNEDRLEELQLEFARQQTKAADLHAKIARLVDAVAAGDSPAIVQRIQLLESEHTVALTGSRQAQESVSAEETRLATLQETAESLKAALRSRLGETEVRRRLRDEIRKTIERIDLYPGGHVPGAVGQGDAPAFQVKFRNGVSRTLWIQNPAPRSDGEPSISAIQGNGYSAKEWEGVLAAGGMEGVWYMPADEESADGKLISPAPRGRSKPGPRARRK